MPKPIRLIVKNLYLILLPLLMLVACSPRKGLRRQRVYAASSSTREVFDIDAFIQKGLEQIRAERLTIIIHGTNLSLINGLETSLEPKGLKSAHANGHKFKHLAQALHETWPAHFPLEHTYFFDWSGKLAADERKQAARGLYDAIFTLRQEPRYKDAHLTLIGYSHGGNVAVNLAYIAQEKGDNSLLFIDRLIMLACPVQGATMQYINSTIFKRVYHFYTPADLVQVMDMSNSLSTPESPWYSSWALPSRTFCAIKPPCLTQVKITLNGRSLHHRDFVTKRFFQALPSIIYSLEQPSLCQSLPQKQQALYHFNLVTRARNNTSKQVEPKKIFSHLALQKKNKKAKFRVDLW